MSMETSNKKRAIVIGGGITGLAAAYRVAARGSTTRAPT